MFLMILNIEIAQIEKNVLQKLKMKRISGMFIQEMWSIFLPGDQDKSSEICEGIPAASHQLRHRFKGWFGSDSGRIYIDRFSESN